MNSDHTIDLTPFGDRHADALERDGFVRTMLRDANAKLKKHSSEWIRQICNAAEYQNWLIDFEVTG